ncbi:hypothetical protein HID58_066319, partial [Brassica napus]
EMIKNLHGVTLKALPGIISLSTFDNGNLYQWVLSGKLSFIKLTRKQSINWGGTSTLINYTRKLANVTVLSHLDDIYYVFDLWVLEDANEHRWSMRQCSFLPWDLQPFYILFFNVENNNIRKVQVKGIADDEGFTHRYGIVINGDCEVYISQNID